MCIKDEGFLEQCFILCHTLKLCAELKKLKEKEVSGRGTARLQNPMVFSFLNRIYVVDLSKYKITRFIIILLTAV